MKKLLITTALLLGAAITPAVGTVFAAPVGATVSSETYAVKNDETVEPQMLTKMSVKTRADGEYVYAVAKNTFTLFISTVPVDIYLYSSDSFTHDLAEMTLEAEAHTGDLNVYKEITCKAAHTEQKYWVAHCVFKTDKQTKTATSYPVLYSVDGKVLS